MIRCCTVPVAACLVLLASCADRDASEGGSLNGLPEWVIETEVRIGSVDDPDAGFSSIDGMALGDDGHLYVLEGQDRQIRVFDSSGRRIRVFGGPGSGPGEILHPHGFGVIGDTVWVSEMMGNQRITLYATDGRVLHTLPSPALQFTGRTGRLVGRIIPARLERGGTVLSQYVYSAGGAAGDTIVIPRVRFRLDGEVIDTLGYDTIGFAATGSLDRLRVGDVTVPRPIRPFVFNDGALTTPDTAEWRIRVERPLAASAGAAAFTVTRTTAAGDTVWSHRYGYEPVAVSEQQRNDLYTYAAVDLRERGVDSLVAEAVIRDELELPAFLPPITRIRRVGDEIWLRREDHPGDWRWLVLDADGTPIGTFTHPRSVEPRILAPDIVWAVETDELGVPWVVRYRVRR